MTASRIDTMLERARRRIAPRVEPAGLAAAAAAGALVVDIRPSADRRADGELPGAHVIERIVLEWRLDPTGAHAIPEAATGAPILLVCNDGYASSLAAAGLVDLGLEATDVIGGYRAWAASRTDASARPAAAG